MIELRL